MTTPTPARTFEVRHLQLARALFAAIAAVMITFSQDHSSEVGLAIFSGFAIATGLVLLVAAWIVYRAGSRWPAVLLGIIALLAGMSSGVNAWRSVTLLFVVVTAWAFASGLVETIASARALRRTSEPVERSQARDGLIVGIITLVLGVGLLLVPAGYNLNYFIDDAGQWFTLTGVTIAVGIFGGYAAIVAVFLAIAGLSPRKSEPAEPALDASPAEQEESA